MAVKKTAPDSPFAVLGADDQYRLIVGSSGLDKTGKNHFGFTMPDPIFGLYFDPGGYEGVAEKFLRGDVNGVPKKTISAVTYRFRKDCEGQEAAIEIRDKFEEDYAYALKNARSIQLDESELWEVYRFAEFGRESNKGQFYGNVNRRYSGLIQDAYDAGVNLQLIQKVKQAWVEDKPTSGFKPTGFPSLKYLVQINLWHGWTKERGFYVDVTNCRQNMDLAGESYDSMGFPEIGQLVFPSSDEDSWI